MSDKKLFVSFVVILTGLFVVPLLQADDHIVEQRTRTYMGRTTPPQETEIWIGDKAYVLKTRSFITLVRYDLETMYSINLRNKRYYEEPLENLGATEPSEEPKTRIQELGFERYDPDYDWIVEETQREETIQGRRCRLFILDGDADYAEEKRELWVTGDVPIDIQRFFRRVIEPGLSKEWQKVYEEWPKLRNSLVMESRVATEGPIAPTIVSNNKVVTVEVADPPEGNYGVPEGFLRVESRDELYSR